MRNIGYNFFLKERREEKNLSRKEASKQIKISSFTLYLIEKGYILVPKKKEESFISLYSLDNNFFKDDLLYPVSEKTEDDNSRLLKILKNKFFVSFLMILLLASIILIPVFNLLMNNAKENPNKYYLSQTIAIREEIFKQDLKKFGMGDKSFEIAQISFMSRAEVEGLKERVLQYMDTRIKSGLSEGSYFMMTDILQESTELLFKGNGIREIVDEAFHENTGENSVVLPGVVSRKKQLVPQLMATMHL